MEIIAKYKNETKQVQIVRVIKAGTKRVFFYPTTIEGQRLTRTNFARMYDAISLGKKYLNMTTC